MKAQHDARTAAAKKQFSTHYAWYYNVLRQLGGKVSRAQIAKNIQYIPCPGTSYETYRHVFKSFRFISRDGKSIQWHFQRLQQKGLSSQYFLNCPKPKSEVRELAIWDDCEKLGRWADFRLLWDHLKRIYGYLGAVVRSGDVGIIWKLVAKYTWNGKSSENVKLYYSYVFANPDASLTLARPSKITESEHAKISAIVPILFRRLKLANVRYPKTAAPIPIAVRTPEKAARRESNVNKRLDTPATVAAAAVQARPDTLLVESLLADDIANDANDANGGHAWGDVRHDVHHTNCTGLCSERDGICQYEENLAAEAS